MDAITTRPSLTGPRGKAWLVDYEAVAYLRSETARKQFAGVAQWVVEAAWAHPVWHSYFVSLVHMRPMPDGPARKLYLEGATHELMLAALDPNVPRQAILTGEAMSYLTPINFGAQFIEPSDAAAMWRVERAVQAVCDGRLSPDTDYLRDWVALFGGNMLKAWP